MQDERSAKKLLMIIPVNTGQFNSFAATYVARALAPDFLVDVKNLDGGLSRIQNRWSLGQNADLVVRLGFENRDAYHGIFVSDFDCAGVEPLREIVDIPVVGGFEPQALTAIALAQTFSIITVDDNLVSLDLSHPRMLGISENLRSIRSIGLTVPQLDDVERVVKLVTKESLAAVKQDGAQSIILGCTGFLNVAEPVAKALAEHGAAVPVTDPNWTGIAFLQGLVRCGLLQSRITYPCPRSLLSEVEATYQGAHAR